MHEYVVRLETSHGARDVPAHGDQTIASALRSVGVPVTSVWTHVRERDGRVSFVSSERELRTLDGPAAARVSRNINTLGLARV